MSYFEDLLHFQSLKRAKRPSYLKEGLEREEISHFEKYIHVYDYGLLDLSNILQKWALFFRSFSTNLRWGVYVYVGLSWPKGRRRSYEIIHIRENCRVTIIQ